jgi:SulP family sulfate permease
VEWPLWIAWQSLLAVAEIGNVYAVQVGLVTLATAVIAQQFQQLRQWAIMMGIVAGTLYSQVLAATLGRHNTLVEQIGNLSLGHIFFPSLPLFRQDAMPDIVALAPSAVTLAMLGLFQTVTALRRMNRKAGYFTDSRSAIFSDAVSNCLLPFLSSLPTCASFNRMWLVHKLGIYSRIAIAISALWVLVLVQFFSKIIAIIPMPAMAAVIMLLGANMLKLEDVKPHFKHKGEAVVFLASFLSVLFLDLFDAVVLGSIVAIAHAKWQQAHPLVTLKHNVLKVRGNLYYGSLPIIESKYHEAVQSGVEGLLIDISECHYIDAEGIRWLSAAKARNSVEFIDRRNGRDRREAPNDGHTGAEDQRRHRRPDRRRRAEF